MNAVVDVRVLGLQVDPSTGASIVLLGGHGVVERVLPIFIGPAEAQAIAVRLQDVSLPRPGTHDLFLDALHAAGSDVTSVCITGIEAGAFIAELEISTGGERRRIDARPSDGIALALRSDAPVTVAEDVFDRAAVPVRHEPGEPFDDEQIDEIVVEFRRFLDEADPDDFVPDAPPSTVADDPEAGGDQPDTGDDDTDVG